MEALSIRRGKSRAINAENPTGEKGRGGMASSNLGKSRKGKMCIRDRYKIAFTNRNLGYGSAIAILIMLLSLIFIISINKTVRIDGTEDS